MIRAAVTKLITGIALFCASVAWTGWAYLHTVADPHRTERVADAVLADPAARLELAQPLAEQIVERAQLDEARTPELRDAVMAAMADPRIVANLTDAVGSAHARSFGVPDPRSGTIDGGLLVGAVRDHLAVAAPDLAGLVPADLVGDLTVPEFELPFAAGIRDAAETATAWLGAAAIGLLTFALIAGDRRRTLRRVGIWAIATGLFWAVAPRLFVLAARAFAPSVDATLSAALWAATSTVTVAATVLVGLGVAALVGARLLRFADADRVAELRPGRRSAHSERLPVRRAGAGDHTGSPSRPAGPTTVVPVAPGTRATPAPPAPAPSPPRPGIPGLPTSVMPVSAGGPGPAAQPTTALPGVPDDPTTVLRRAGSGDPVAPPAGVPGAPVPPVVGAGSPGAFEGDDLGLDPWVHFGGPAVDPETGEPLPRRPPLPDPGRDPEGPAPGPDAW